MSNKKDSPVIESTVVKKSTSSKEDVHFSSEETQKDSKTKTHFDSIEALKEAAHIADHDSSSSQDETQQDQSDEPTSDTAKDTAKKEATTKASSTTVTDKQDSSNKNTDTQSELAKQSTRDSKQEDEKSSAQAATESKSADTKNDKTQSAESKPTANTAKKEASRDADQATTAEDADKKDAANNVQKDEQKANAKPQGDRVRVAILGGNRIPFARSNGPYANASNIDMLSAALNGLVERFDLQGQRVGEVVAGAVLKLSRDLNLTRESALNTALDPHTPAYDISQACGTGLQATFAAANKIALGIIDSAITGGVDTTSDAPIAVGDGLRKALIQLGAAKNNKQRLKALLNINPKELIDAPQNGEPRTGLSMGEHQAITALEWNISREDQDDLAFNSHKNLARAYDEGFFDDLMTPYKGLTRDNNLRPDTTKDKLAKLKPVFGKKNANPTMTAANSTPLTDGASCVLLANDEWAEAHGFKPLAYIVHQETAAVDFIGKTGEKEGLLMAPAYAVPRMLERAGLSLQDFDYYEIHEAFASQVLATLAAWEDETFCKERLGLDAPLGSIDRSKLNVNGSSLAAGHPFAATGGRILATAAKLLDQKGSGRALISICAAGGQGVTCILEKQFQLLLAPLIWAKLIPFI